jgi:hypothetical protein
LTFLDKLSNRCIYYELANVTWLEAKEICDTNKLELAEVYTKEEFGYIGANYKEFLKKSYPGFWVGSNVIEHEKEPGQFDYFWDKRRGEPEGKIPNWMWYPVNVNPSRGAYDGVYESCVAFFSDDPDIYGLNDLTCHWKAYYFCQTDSNLYFP